MLSGNAVISSREGKKHLFWSNLIHYKRHLAGHLAMINLRLKGDLGI